jgi:DNA-directed RNA polymerase subunit alpha
LLRYGLTPFEEVDLLIDISLPKVERVASAENYGRFKVEPLESGFGITLGNSFRRVLLAALQGAAITSVKIDGVQHEFATLNGVREDITELILNLKKVRLRSLVEQPVLLRLEVAGECEVHASDISAPSDVEIVTPDQYLATLDGADARLELELTVERGRGYVPADVKEGTPIGVIPIDAIFTPVTKVNYVVENTRIGGVANFDRLILEIWTDGTMDAGDALSQAADILVQHFSTVADLTKVQPLEKQPLSAVPIPPQIYDTPIEELGLSARTYNCLKRSNISKVGEILEKDEADLLALRNFGRKSLDELRDQLIAHGFIPSALGSSGERQASEEQEAVGVPGEVESA